jgi:hypothetical protein
LFWAQLEYGRKEIEKIRYTPKPSSILSEDSLLKAFLEIVNESKKIAHENDRHYSYNITEFYNSIKQE